MPPVLGEDKAGGHQANKGKHQGQEVLMHQLRYTKTVLCNLIFLIPREVPRPASCLFAKLKAVETEQTITCLQNRTSSQKNERISFAPPQVYVTSLDSPHLRRISENRRIVFCHLNSSILLYSGTC